MPYLRLLLSFLHEIGPSDSGSAPVAVLMVFADPVMAARAEEDPHFMEWLVLCLVELYHLPELLSLQLVIVEDAVQLLC